MKSLLVILSDKLIYDERIILRWIEYFLYS